MDSPALELRVRRLQRLLVLALILALLPWCAIGAAAWFLTRERIELPGALSARSLEVRSKSGQVLVLLGADGGVGLRMRNADGREVAYLGSEPAGGGNLSLRAKDGKILVVARDNDGHRGSVTAFGPNEKPLAFLGGGLRDDGALQTWNASGATIASLCTNQFGQPVLQLQAKDGHVAFELGTREGGQTDLTLNGPQSKPGLTLAAEAPGGRFALFDQIGAERVQVQCCSEHSKATLSVFDGEGDTVVALGEHEDAPGGYFRALAQGEHAAFYAGVGDEGCGRISLYHPSGKRLFLATLADDGLGGAIYVNDLAGELTLEAPAPGPSGAK